MANDYHTILTAVKTLVDGLSLQLNSSSLTSAIRKLPVKQDEIDPSTSILICPDEKAEQFKRTAFGHYQITYQAQVAIVSPNNADFSTNLQTYLDWRQSIAASLAPKLSLSNVLTQELTFDPPLDRRMISANLDFLALGLAVTCYY